MCFKCLPSANLKISENAKKRKCEEAELSTARKEKAELLTGRKEKAELLKPRKEKAVRLFERHCRFLRKLSASDAINKLKKIKEQHNTTQHLNMYTHTYR